MKTTLPTAEQLKLDWNNNPRWAGITRPYSPEDVERLREELCRIRYLLSVPQRAAATAGEGLAA